MRDRRGASLVEFSLIAPLLILLMCGMAEFANGMRQYHVMQKGVRDAARYVARVQMTGCTLPGTAITNAQNLALTGRTSGGTNLLSTWTNPATVSVTVSTCFNNASETYRGRAEIPIIQVQANAPYVDLGLLDVIGVAPINLQVTHRQIWIGA
ncbi:MAG: TadE/TadG family type IV pilus assembly protein [Hyphomonadaceae bacterium]|nr:TadE/TadG family type IV pilus assembly protein [Hyphomonadaceae bacterium]